MREIKKLLIGLAEYYDYDMSAQKLGMFAEDLEDIDPGILAEAIKAIRKDPTVRFFPRPAQIRERIFGNPEDQAEEAAGKIHQAIVKFGWARPEEARGFMGEIAWHVVGRCGGWQKLCEATYDDQIPILKAQWRKAAASHVRTESVQRITGPAIEHKPEHLPEINFSPEREIDQ